MQMSEAVTPVNLYRWWQNPHSTGNPANGYRLFKQLVLENSCKK